MVKVVQGPALPWSFPLDGGPPPSASLEDMCRTWIVGLPNGIAAAACRLFVAAHDANAAIIRSAALGTGELDPYLELGDRFESVHGRFVERWTSLARDAREGRATDGGALIEFIDGLVEELRGETHRYRARCVPP